MIRARQWYKNLLIFLPIVFSQKLTEIPLLKATLWGFVCLCLISSVNYIINDIADYKKDRLNPEKKGRWIASGKIKRWQAAIITLIMLIAVIYLSLQLSLAFAAIAMSLFLLTLLYTFIFKNFLFTDIILISVNFVLRAIAGVFVIMPIVYADISPWLIMAVFFLSLFLSAGKRHGEVLLIKPDTKQKNVLDHSFHIFRLINRLRYSQNKFHRIVLQYYTPEITISLLIISTTLLILSYSLYTFFAGHVMLIFTLPFALYIMLRYLSLILAGSEIARHPDRIVKDKPLLAAILLFFILAFLLLYFF